MQLSKIAKNMGFLTNLQAYNRIFQIYQLKV